MLATWTNWSGGVTATPRQQVAPQSEADLAALVGAGECAGTAVRVVGSGHSFTPLCATAGTLVSLAGPHGLIATDAQAGTATIWAGTPLHELGAPLLAAGLAMENLGDIDRQTLAGAISTGTHGTGPTLGNLSAQVVGLRLLLASGDFLDCSPAQHPTVFAAARVAFGVLGIISQVTLRVLPAYRLHERTWAASFAECVAQWPELSRRHRHAEFFWSPADDACALKTLHPTTATELPTPTLLPDAPPRLQRYLAPERIDWSYRIFPSERTRRFNEMEFALPAEYGLDCLRELRHLMHTRHPDVTWPVEYRTVHADDIPLSPAYGRETVTISIHQGADLPYQSFFTDAEALFRHYQGRPHWGKLHALTARDLRDLYPRWTDFLIVREQLDPAGRFLTPYLR
ncbi:MAG: D-arabinono-1,4-lactone oxidase, partial [Thermomicrobiales bacterium]